MKLRKRPSQSRIVHTYVKNLETVHFKMGPRVVRVMTCQMGGAKYEPAAVGDGGRRQCSAASENALRLPEHAG